MFGSLRYEEAIAFLNGVIIPSKRVEGGLISLMKVMNSIRRAILN